MQPLSVTIIFRLIRLNWALPLMYRLSTVQRAMNTTTLVTASTILDPAVKSEKKVKILIEHIHKSNGDCSQRKEIRFAVTLISVL